MAKTKNRGIFITTLIFTSILFSCLPPTGNFLASQPARSQIFPAAQAATSDTLNEDYPYFEKYDLYLKYQKKQKYKKYRKYAKNKDKYGFASAGDRAKAKDAYNKYKLYLKDPAHNRAYAQYQELYNKYKKYKKYVTPYQKYSQYSKYKKYNKDSYDKGKNYGTAENKAGYDRYKAALAAIQAEFGEADLGCGVQDGSSNCLGPEITVGLIEYTKKNLQDDYFRLKANEDYNILDKNDTVIATVPADINTRVKYDSDGRLKIYNSISDTLVQDEVRFAAADGTTYDTIFDINKPDTENDQYRGKMKLKFYNSSNADGDRIWAINTVPLEQYVWGMGEMTGSGDGDHNKVMTTIFRTYGYWKMKFSTKYAEQGFKVNATPGNQLFYGYIWEANHPRIKEAAEESWGKIVMYHGEIALTPYSSWSDGRTRSFEERWGSNDYPWCQSVSDPYGKNPTMPTADLEAAGNHMVGLIANGSLSLATDHHWDWQDILSYYYTGINLLKAY
jgi:hypothetical protein